MQYQPLVPLTATRPGTKQVYAVSLALPLCVLLHGIFYTTVSFFFSLDNLSVLTRFMKQKSLKCVLPYYGHLDHKCYHFSFYVSIWKLGNESLSKRLAVRFILLPCLISYIWCIKQDYEQFLF